MHETTTTSRLREFIDACLLKKKSKYDLPLVDGEFPLDKFISLMKEEQNNRVYFKVCNFDYLYIDMDGECIASFLDVNDLVSFLFEKIELFGWRVKAINYVERGVRSIGADMCYMWLSIPKGERLKHDP